MRGTHTTCRAQRWLFRHGGAEPSTELGPFWGGAQGACSAVGFALQKRFIEHVSLPSVPLHQAGAALPG